LHELESNIVPSEFVIIAVVQLIQTYPASKKLFDGHEHFPEMLLKVMTLSTHSQLPFDLVPLVPEA